jgi:lysophospholipase L1-like esterase
MKTLYISLLCMVLTGCYDPSIDTVIVRLGDSIMEQNTRVQFQAELLQDRAPMTINNAIGGTTFSIPEQNEYWVQRIRNINALVVPDLMFISLGTNDAVGANGKIYKGAEYTASCIDNLMQAVNPSTEVYWMPPHKDVGGWRDQVYADIVLAAERWPNLTIMDFDDWVASQGLDKRNMWKSESDPIHFSPAGNDAFTAMMISVQRIE